MLACCKVGQDRVVVLSSMCAFSNAYLARGDNAVLLDNILAYLLARPEDRVRASHTKEQQPQSWRWPRRRHRRFMQKMCLQS